MPTDTEIAAAVVRDLTAENDELRQQNTFLLALIQDLADDALSRPSYTPVGFYWRSLRGTGRPNEFDWGVWQFAASRAGIPTDRSGIEVLTLFVQGDPDA